MSRPERQKTVLDILKSFRQLEPLKQLFWSELNYQRINQPLTRHGWTETATKALVEDPVLFAGGGQNNDFHVIYGRLASDRLLFGLERPVVSRLLRDHPYALFVFSNEAQDRWHFLNVKYDEQAKKRRLFRRITIGPEERLRTASERLGLLDLEAISPDLFGLSPLTIQQQHDEAFDVEAVTKQFFGEYKAVFNNLQDDLARQTKDKAWAHDYALQFINRVMFLYFVQRKRWLGNDTEFLRSFWESYEAGGRPQDSFFSQWLKVLFFEAFNNKYHGGHRHFPEQIRNALAVAPYLNGGLFRQNDLDDKYPFNLTDLRFEQLFRFLERYNFTISEDSPLDQEVAVDPEMIGKVYESLVNVEETSADQRSAAGIFYTPRTEIDLMCRLALVDHLSNHLGAERKNLLYETVFALEADEKAAADKALTEAKLWRDLDSRLREITILDLTCGSGSFLVGMLHILDDLQERANRQLGRQESRYERKKRIIGQSLYGVDVMDWACHVAELRLWLALIVDSDFPAEELHVRKEPLLPHFTFKIRCGDSLVQEVGGINLGHIRGSHEIPSEIKGRITRLKAEKLKFYNNDPSCQFKSDDQAMREELRLFRDILDARSHKIHEDIKSLRRKIEGPSERQIRLDGTVEERSHQMELAAATLKTQIEALEGELERVSQAREALKTAKDVPFVWDIAFVEMFQGEKEGFDIVISNPPYVRQESIADPRLPREKVTTENKKTYKTKLAISVCQAYPRYFGYKASSDTPSRKLDAKSDLYIYFYFHGLSLLNPKGSFCFITSNSWLDVGYGADLQEFLLKHCHVKAILDNQVKRSFAQADINTVIALFSPPDETREWGLDQTAKFIMFKAPYEHVLSAVVFEEVESATERKVTPEYRVYAVSQRTLLKKGCELPDQDNAAAKKRKPVVVRPLVKVARYTGNKWGGKYFRAPDFLQDIFANGPVGIVKLGSEQGWSFGRGRRTGCDDFFYLTRSAMEQWRIEGRFLRPLCKSPAEFVKIPPRTSKLLKCELVFLCHEPKPELRGTKALKYIEYGEQKGFHRRNLQSVGGRWYDLGDAQVRHILLPIAFNDRFFAIVNDAKYEVHQRFATITLDKETKVHRDLLAAILNSSVVALMVEVLGRRSLGQGALDFPPEDWRLIGIPHPNSFTIDEAKEFVEAFVCLSNYPPRSVFDQIRMEEQKILDKLLLRKLNLRQDILNEVYNCLTDMVSSRLSKARSLSTKHNLLLSSLP